MIQKSMEWIVLAFLLLVSTVNGQSSQQPDPSSGIEFVVLDETGNLLPCRIHLKNEAGQPVQYPGLPFWNDHFVCNGSANLDLSPGQYEYVIERGPEHERKSGTVKIDGTDHRRSLKLTLHRITNLRDEGWLCADLHVHRRLDDIPLLMKAEDLDYAPVISWWNQAGRKNAPLDRLEFAFDRYRMFEVNVGEDEREGGALLYFGLRQAIDLSVESREFPSPLKFVNEARAQNEHVWIDIEKPFWWDVPVWLSTGKMNSIGLANNHMLRQGMLESEAWGKPRDRSRFPSRLGNGYWTQEIYYQILNSGIRIPPSAGSASGVLKNPVGYNRIYVYDAQRKQEPSKRRSEQQEFSRERFWTSCRSGHSFVTNGPLLRVSANGKIPGTNFELNSDGIVELNLDIQLDSNDPIAAIEIIHNGRICKTILCKNYLGNPDRQSQSVQRESFDLSLKLAEPGWFLVRAIADRKDTFRFASTAPFFLGQPIVYRNSTEFFLDWTKERITRVENTVRNPEHRASILRWHQDAEQFWTDRTNTAEAIRKESFSESKARTIAAIARSTHQFGLVDQRTALAEANAAKNSAQLAQCLKALTLATVSINPESRVKIASTRDRVAIRPNHGVLFLLNVENIAGITAPLRLRAMDLSKSKQDDADWCDIKIVDNPYTSSELTGKPEELKLVAVRINRRGLNEIRIVADAGQGTQDLGFRATMDLMIDSREVGASLPKLQQ